MFDILATEYRRQVVVRLDRETGTLPFETLVTSVTAMRTGLEPAALEETDREPTRIALYHSHLPKLVDTGVVEFDRETGTVAPGPRLDVVAASLEAVEKLHAS
ncbi:DUF7344 domain-containing protein [Halalkalicoccus jeotgali]|uniref:DUF7344 domain-containing protein n=1 Tax=Halalkalicoccus jeotgali TaxID=413810 RepID=UPI000B16D88E|nr:hypothetical protein [Halalkalicoccus jeotgali]